MIQSQTFRCHQMSLSTTLKFGGRRSSYDSQQPCKTENSQGQTVEQSSPTDLATASCGARYL